MSMNNIWLTSDHHFDHQKVIEFENKARPFTCVEEMHEVLIERWNAVVRPHDTVYHLGDFCFGRKNIAIAERLNGKKRLVMGNHDAYPNADYLKYFDKLYGVLSWKGCILSHVPVHPNQLQSRYKLCVHGHLHGKSVMHEDTYVYLDIDGSLIVDQHKDDQYFNVSVEQNNLTPFHADQILERLKELSE